MDRAEAIEALKKWQGHTDWEIAHEEADKILCGLLTALGYGDVVEEWWMIDKWYA